MKIALAFVLLFVLPGAAVAYEQPEYEVLEKRDDFEIRRYAPYLVAETEVSGTFESTGNEAFRRLAGYLFGDNRSREKMSMTAPVTQEPSSASEKMEMTAPVTQVRGDASGSYVFAFVMPSKYTRETLPEPVDARIRIREVPARTVAARRFSGTWRGKRFVENETALLAAVAAAGSETIGAPMYARYDAPFKPWFLRRNEVMIEVRAATQ
jgi:hypothetical protein